MKNNNVMKRSEAEKQAMIQKANTRAAIQKFEDPGKTADYACRIMEKSVENVTNVTANLGALAKGYERELAQINKDIAELDKWIEICKTSSSHSKEERIADIQAMVQQKVALQERRDVISELYYDATASSASAQQNRLDILTQYDKAKHETELIKGKVQLAKTKRLFGKFGAFVGKGTVSLGLFNSSRDKANRMLDAANERERLDKEINNPTLSIQQKYASEDIKVQSEMAKIIQDMQ